MDLLYWLQGPVPETPAPKAEMPPWGETKVVGKPLPRVDAYERVSGSAVYPLDFALPDMLHAAILRCPHAHAQVKSIDTSAAEKMPGVRAVITGKSPGADIPWYRSRGKWFSKLFDDRARHEGDEVAAVAAETRAQAYDALKAIRVEYEVLAFVLDPREALKPDAPLLHDGGNRYGDPPEYARGDVAAGFAAADAVVEGTYSTACEIHSPMEVHGSVVKWDGNRLTVWDSTQGVFEVQQAVAQALKLPLANVRVIGHYMGGGFGSKLEAGKYTVIAALLAKMTARPVKLFLSREENFLNAGNRPANTMTVKVGAKKDGTLTAIEFLSIGLRRGVPGRRRHVVPGDRPLHLPEREDRRRERRHQRGPGPRDARPGLPAGGVGARAGDGRARAEARNGPGRAAAEERPEGEPAARQPALHVHRPRRVPRATGRRRSAGARRGSARRGTARSGRGSAWPRPSGATGAGPPATVVVKLFADGSVNVNTGAADIGTGTKTVMAQIVAEELGVPLEKIQIEHADTGTTQYSGPSGGSKTVPSDMPAARAAAIEVRDEAPEGGRRGDEAPRRRADARGRRGRLDEGPVEEARRHGRSGAPEAAGPRRRRDPRAERRGEGHLDVRDALRRGRGEHADRRGDGDAPPRRPGQRRAS